VRQRKPIRIWFVDDGIVPNNARFPLLVYRGVVAINSRRGDPAVLIDSLFDLNGWGRSWRDTVYDFVHYHSQVHEVLGIARGNAVLELGGIKGRRLQLKAGDVAILPAGTGHRLLESSRTFLVVGAYPTTGKYDECTDTRDREAAAKRIRKTKKPETDPVFGKDGPLTKLWRTSRR
jgi:uncharacterized protein YjlB